MLVSELIEEVREQSDEENTSDLTSAKILNALNRAQQRLARLTVRHYPELLKRSLTQAVASGGSTITMPELAQAFTNVQVDGQYGGVWHPVIYTNTTNVLALEGPITSPIPLNWTQQGNIITLYPTLSSGVNIRIRYEKKPFKLVEEQGRITSIDAVNGILYLDALGSSLSTSVSNLTAFVNVIDQFTGDVKGTYQVASLTSASSALTIKTSSLSRSSVFGLGVSDALSSTITEDDYVCLASGTCIPFFFREYTDFLSRYATNEVKLRYGLLTELDIAALKDIEDDVKQMWASRPQGLRMQPRNPHWNRTSLATRSRLN